MRLTTTQRIVYTAIFAALATVFNCFSITFPLSAGTGSISFVYLACFLAGILLGPIEGLCAGLVGDILGCIIAPKGDWIPLITLGSAMVGLVMGLSFRIPLGRTPEQPNYFWIAVRIVIGTVLTLLICSAGLNTLGIYLRYSSGKVNYLAYLLPRLPLQILVGVINGILTFPILLILNKTVFRNYPAY